MVAGRSYLSGIDPRNDANHGEEHAKNKIHSDHGTESVIVRVWIVGEDVVLGQDTVHKQCGGHASCGDNQRLDTTNFVQDVESNGTIYDRERARNTDNFQGCTCLNTEEGIDLRAVVVTVKSQLRNT